MLKKTVNPLLALAALGVAFSFNGCSCSAQMGTPPKAPEPVAPAPAPAPPPAPPPPPPVAAVEPAPPPKLDKIKPIGKAKIEGDQIKIPGKIEFDINKSTIREDAGSKEILTTMAEVLKQNPSVTKLRIEGHTDNDGGPEHNKTLSQGRADAVAKWLTDHGVDKSRIETVGMGEDKPMVANDTPLNKQLNRRTEFHVVEVDGKKVEAPAATPAAPAAATKK